MLCLVIGAAVPAVAGGLGSNVPIPNLNGLVDGLTQLLSTQLIVGFALGLFAGEAGRVAWTAGLGAWNALLAFATLATRYGVVAGLLGAVLYFV